jgi:HTH-type transcriptional regulator/antitoxin MqsA
MINKNEACPFCRATAYHHQIKPLTLRYKSQSITVKQPGYWCDECGEGVIGGEDKHATQKQLQTFRATVDKLLPPDDIKRIREKLKLSQKNASVIFGGGVNAFSRYERGETPIPKPLSQLLQLLNRHPSLLDELNKINQRKIVGSG